MLPKNLQEKIDQRIANNALRKLHQPAFLVDFSSNDYLGFAKNEALFRQTHQFLIDRNSLQNGATGSRLLSGNFILYEETEAYIANFHKVESALIFNSGYDANVGFFGNVPQRNDVVLYDEFSHSSIRDGIAMGKAKAFKFKHNHLEDLENLILKFKKTAPNIYVVTESVFSMDGDSPVLEKLTEITTKHQCYLVIDEAHALGVFGKNGAGLVHQLGLQNQVFATIVTFGKALGCHGAAVLGSFALREYLINFCRSFIYTTALSPHAVASIYLAYKNLIINKKAIEKLGQNIAFYQKNNTSFASTFSVIQSIPIAGNDNVKKAAFFLQENGLDVKPILSPTVPLGQERLRICLHSYNSEKEILMLLELVGNFIKTPKLRL